jgi:endonuclease YncB( thermonuclease family)
MGGFFSKRREYTSIGDSEPRALPKPKSQSLNPLEDANWNNTVEFVPPLEQGVGCSHFKVIKVYDGDTITIAAKLPWSPEMIEENTKIYRFHVRLLGIDTPEMRAITRDEKEVAHEIQAIMAKKLMGTYVQLKNVSLEKYGRILADVYVTFNGETTEVHLNDWMIQSRYAVKYDGGTKNRPSSWRKYIDSGVGISAIPPRLKG